MHGSTRQHQDLIFPPSLLRVWRRHGLDWEDLEQTGINKVTLK